VILRLKSPKGDGRHPALGQSGQGVMGVRQGNCSAHCSSQKKKKKGRDLSERGAALEIMPMVILAPPEK